MSVRRFSTEQFAGARVAIPTGEADRLLDVARADLARWSRHVDDDAEPAHVIGQWLAEKERGLAESDVDENWTRIHRQLYSRLIVAADNHFTRLGAEAPAVPEARIASWLAALEKARVLPNPSAEPGDLLVKVARAETWTFTVHGWRELAPIELQTDEPLWTPDAGSPTPLWGERLADARRDRRAYDVAAGHPEPDFLVGPSATVRAGWDMGAGGGCGRHGVYDGHRCPDCVRGAEAPRFFGKSVVEEELDRLHAEKNAPTAAADPVPRNVRDALDELHQHADVLEDIAQALGDHPDGGNNSPHYEAIAQARTFARAIEYSRGIIWKHATRRHGSS